MSKKDLVIQTIAGDPRYQLYRKGRRLYGAWGVTDKGVPFYLAIRRHGEYYRQGAATLSEAMRDGRAAWALDDETIINMRARKVRMVGVIVRDTFDCYVTPVESFFDAKKRKFIDYTSKGGSLQRFLPLEFWVKVPAKLFGNF